MKKPNFLVTMCLVVAATSISSVHAERTNVFCARPDGSEWYWLVDSSTRIPTLSDIGYYHPFVSVPGEWERFNTGGAEYFMHFSVSEENYLLVNSQCQLGYFAQPANHSFNGWRAFKVNLSNGRHFIAPGHRTEYGSTSVPRISDIRLKQDIQPLQDSLDKISRVGGYSYSWRPGSIQDHKAGQYEYGVIAQEIQTEFPGLVKNNEQGYLRVDYRGLIPVLLESIKELKARVEALEAES